MELRFLGLILLSFALVTNFSLSNLERANSQTSKSTLTLSQAEQELINEVNRARAQPQLYAGFLEKLKPMFKGKRYTPEGASAAFETQEGWSAVEDAIKFMRAAKPAAALTISQGLSLCAKSHVTDQSASGATGHRGGNRTMIEDRVKPYGSWSGGIGENLAYGNEPARERLLTRLIDDGFATRGHRNRVMSDTYKVAGVSCGPHREYGTMCVVTLAGGFTEAGATKASDAPTAKPISSSQTQTNGAAKTSNTAKSNTTKSTSTKTGTTAKARKS